jgi:[ribosomal protein S18]-alanine N-acetyltransferase
MATREDTAAGINLNYSISPMTEHDLVEVVEIEELSALSPWGWEAYYKELGSGADVMMLVARIGGRDARMSEGKGIAGFIVSRVIADELHVNNVAVRPEFRRQGIAAQLLSFVLNRGKRAGIRLALLEVRAGNKAAQELYRSCGFEATGSRSRYYREPVEDALLMSALLQGSP